MKYKINTAVYGNVFTVPALVTDKYLKLSSASQLKTLLWIFRNPGKEIAPEIISRDIGYSQTDITDALTVLCEWGILNSEETEQRIPGKDGSIPEEEVQTGLKKKHPENKTVHPTALTNEQIIKRCNESPEIKNFFSEIQSLIGKTIGYSSESILLNLFDHYGLPLEVIYMLVDYCVSVGKANFSYIQKVGIDWGEREIDTIEKAADQINILRSCDTLWNKFAKAAGIQTSKPTSVQSAYIRTWTTDMKFNLDMIYAAYEETMNHTGKISFPYMNKVLTNWFNSGIRTVSDVEQSRLKTHDVSPDKKHKKSERKTSYDMNEVFERAAGLPVYKKGD